jgi:hypothetical protein
MTWMDKALESPVVIFYLVADLEPFRTGNGFEENVPLQFIIKIKF